MPTPARVPAEATLRVDVLVVGAGVAGLVAALDLLDARPGTSVAVLDKGAVGETGSTPLAQGGMAAALGPGDSPARHAADTLRAGDGLADPAAAAVLASEAPDRVRDLLARGARFDRGPGGELHLAREGGQSVPRCVHATDATGAELFRALRAAASGRLTRLQGVAAELVVRDEAVPPRAGGVWALLDRVEPNPVGPAQDGGLACVLADAVVLATGGCGGLYASTTNRDGATADGLALAWRAGASLVDLEFVQFHPTGLRVAGGGAQRLLLTEALRGAGAVLVDADGRRFMPERHPDADLAPRHVVTKALLDQPRGGWLDATALGVDQLDREFPTVVRGVRAHGFDLAREPVPVEPVQHYLVGGVETDLDGATTVPGLWAAGEVACTGVHGANRMPGNSLAQACVFAHRVARAVAGALDAPAREPAAEPAPPRFTDAVASDPAEARAELRRALSVGAGPLRSARSLDAASKALAGLAGPRPARERAALELDHALEAAGLLIRSARLREESRGVHWREDAPAPQAHWAGVRLRLRQVTEARGTTDGPSR